MLLKSKAIIKTQQNFSVPGYFWKFEIYDCFRNSGLLPKPVHDSTAKIVFSCLECSAESDELVPRP